MIDGFDRRAFLCVLGAAGALPLAGLARSPVAALATGGGRVAVLEARERSGGGVQTARGW